MELSQKDEQVIALLRENGRMPISEIARRLPSSRTAAQVRVQKLERNGVIDGYSVKLSADFFSSRVRALVMIKFPPGRRANIEKALTMMAHVTALHSISGVFDLVAVVSARSMDDLDTVLDDIGCLEGVGETMSSIILSTKVDR